MPGGFSETVLLPGDPLRARYIADGSPTNVHQVTATRETIATITDVIANDPDRIWSLPTPTLSGYRSGEDSRRVIRRRADPRSGDHTRATAAITTAAPK